MSDNQLIRSDTQQNLSSLSLDTSALTPDYYVMHYLEFLPRYISHGHPTADTLNSYRKNIDAFIRWCINKQRHPMSMQDYQIRIYREELVQAGYKPSTIGLHISAVRSFYMVAEKLHFIQENPCADIHTEAPFSYDNQFDFFTPQEEAEIIEAFEQTENPVARTRDLAMLYLMCVEGLRKVEVHRMNDEDINLETGIIVIHGKGHNGVIYPSPDTMERIKDYLKVRGIPVKDGLMTPTFISLSNQSKGKRVSRRGIESIMNRVLTISGHKKKGACCHVFRHSCGTNLYAATKDLRVVQETLRQRDPKVTARYAHVQQRMDKRYTSSIVPKKD